MRYKRLGWNFIRIRGSAFYKLPDATMEWAFQELESYGIKPNYSSDANEYSENAQKSNEIIDEIKRRAEQIRREWKGDTGEDFNEADTIIVDNLESCDIKIVAKVENEKIHEDCNLSNKEPKITVDFDINGSPAEDEKSFHPVDLMSEQSTLEIPGLSNTNLQMALDDEVIQKDKGVDQNNDIVYSLSDETTFEQDRTGTNHEVIEIGSEEVFDIALAIKNKGYRFIDNRSKGGALWVYGDLDIGKELKKFSDFGVQFQYSPNGGKATGHKPGMVYKIEAEVYKWQKAQTKNALSYEDSSRND